MNCNLKKFQNNKQCKRSVGEAEFRIIIPKNDNSGKPIKQDIIKKYGSKMNKIFGGSTIIPKTKGCYSPPGSKDFFCESSLMIIGVRDFDNPYTNDRKKSSPLKTFNKFPEELNASQRKKQLRIDYQYVKSLGKKMSKELGQDTIFVEDSPLIDAAMVSRGKTWRQSLPSSKLGKKEIFSED